MEHLCEKFGEDNVFLQDAERQIGPEITPLPGLQTITNLEEAIQAIETIVHQGEGASEEIEDGHYQQFMKIKKEFEAILNNNSSFIPARPAATNPLMRKPIFTEGRVWVSKPEAASVMDLANALYGQMLRLLSQAFGRHGHSEEKRVLVNTGVDMMYALTLAGEQLTTMKANDEQDCNAGVSFAMLSPLTRVPHGESEWRLLMQRFMEIEAGAKALEYIGKKMQAASKIVSDVFEKFQREIASLPDEESSTKSKSSKENQKSEIEPAPESLKDGDREVVEGEKLTLSFDTKRCIHARHCVTGAPQTFLANVKGPWLHPDKTHPDSLATIAAMCPSGAVQVKRKDGRPDEQAPEVNLCYLRENGPLAIRADIRMDGKKDGYRATLCRCGKSKNKPYCDSSHIEAGFQATGEPDTRTKETLKVRDEALNIQPKENGPYQVSGSLEICAGTGRMVDRVQSAFLCRCGGSANKPFCDGTHKQIGFDSSI